MSRLHFIKLLRTLSILSIIILLGRCNNNPISPTTKPIYGVGGKIYDTDGSLISDAKIFCLFFLNSIPINPTTIDLQKISNSMDFNFELFQNFPNPCSNSLYVRFSLPEKCSIEFTIINESDKKLLYKRSDTLQYGLFQLYFKNIVDSLDIKNGVYLYHLTAVSDSGKTYNSEKSFLVVNDSVNTNAVSDNKGSYFFNIQDAFIGDIVAVMNGDTFAYYQILDTNINLLIVKKGYKSTLINVQLLPEKILNRDIIITKDQ